MPEKTTLPANLRVADLIAKSARVTLRDTLRVLAATDAVGYLFDTDPLGVIEACTYDPNRPTPEQVAACEQAFFALRDQNHPHGKDIALLLMRIKELM